MLNAKNYHFRIEGPDAISTRAVENKENYCPRESKIKVAKCDEQKICLDAACQCAFFLYGRFFNKKITFRDIK